MGRISDKGPLPISSTAWYLEPEQDKSEGCCNMHGRQTKKENIVDFSQVSSTHGFLYSFEPNVLPISRVFWIITMVALFILSVYLNVSAFIQWMDHPVLTTVESTGHPVSDLDFPAITICGQGTIDATVDLALEQQIREFYKEVYGIDLPEIDRSQSNATAEFLNEYQQNYTIVKFPGAELSSREIVRLMASYDPDSLVDAAVSVAGEDYDTCDLAAGGTGNSSIFGNSTGGSSGGGASKKYCEPGLDTHDTNLDQCFGIAVYYQTDETEAYSHCNNYYANVFQFEGTQTQLVAMKPHFNANLSYLADEWIWTSAYRYTNYEEADGIFWMWDGSDLTKSNAVTTGELSLNQTSLDDWTLECLVIKYNTTTTKYQAKATDCLHSYHYSLCQAYPQEPLDCSSPARRKRRRRKRSDGDLYDGNKLDNILNPTKAQKKKTNIDQTRKVFRQSFTNLNMSVAYPSMFELLWYSQLPCFDIKKYTSAKKDHRSMLKRCFWKGMSINCNAIFTTFPTDRGMCCTFNMKKADEIFEQSKYLNNIAKLQKRDTENAFEGNIGLPKWYTDNNEPRPQQGVGKGLSVLLDAHTDQVAKSTVYDSFQGFMAVINSRASYPIVSQGNIRIRPGHDTLVAITATDVKASENEIKSLDVDKRNCFFPDEGNLKMHKKYSYSSCLLECQIEYTLGQMKNMSCLPWYLPTKDNEKTHAVCDPWDAVLYRETLEAMTQRCSQCRPDCEGTTYHQTVTSVPFRQCDNRNLGISEMCQFGTVKDVINPPIFGEQLLQEYGEDLPSYLEGQYESNIRQLLADDEVFSTWAGDTTHQTYDAYEKDIAMVHFYFDSPTVFRYRRARRMTGIDFLSQVGGLLGLCLGLSLASVVELAYWFGYRFWFGCKTVDKKVQKEDSTGSKSKFGTRY